MPNEIKIDIPADVPREAFKFFQRLIGPVADASDLLGDKIRFYRWRSAIKTLKRAEEFARANNVAPKEVPLKFLVPFLEKSSLEDETSPLIDAWARLLVHASQDYDVRFNYYSDMLAKIGPQQARLLQRMRSRSDARLYGRYLDAIVALKRRPRISNEATWLREAFDSVDDLSADSAGRLWLFSGPIEKAGEAVELKIAGEWVKIEDDEPLFENEEMEISATILKGLDLIKPYGVGYVHPDQVLRHYRWAELTRLGFDFAKCCEGLDLE